MENKNLEKKYNLQNVYDKEGNLLPVEQRTFTTNEGYKLTLIDGGSRVSYVKLQIGNWITETAMRNVTRGSIKYPYRKSVFSTGMFGEGKYSKKHNKKAYTVWQSMLSRAYNPKYHAKQPTYIDATVCEKWHNFQNFAKWFYGESNYQDGWHLDKDLLSGTSKIYSPETCVFLPRELNNFLRPEYTNSTSGYAGAYYNKPTNKYVSSIVDIDTGKSKHLGLFKTAVEAHNVHLEARVVQANKWKLRLHGLIPDSITSKIK